MQNILCTLTTPKNFSLNLNYSKQANAVSHLVVGHVYAPIYVMLPNPLLASGPAYSYTEGEAEIEVSSGLPGIY